MSKRVTVSVDVEVWLDDIDTDDLAEELASRGSGVAALADVTGESTIPSLSSGEHHPMHEIYYALKFGLEQKALDMMRAHINNELGVAL